MEIDIQDQKERLRGQEIMRLLEIYRENGSDSLLDAALDGREKSPESVKKLFKFLLNNYGSESKVTEAFWSVCSAYLRASTELTSTELDEIHRPRPRPGDPDFKGILDEFRDEGRL